MVGNFIENESLLRKFSFKQLKKFAKENKIATYELNPSPWTFWAKDFNYEELIEKVAPEVQKNKIIEFAKKHGIDI